MTKVLYVTTFYGQNIGGAEQSMKLWADNLNKYDINIITTRKSNDRRAIYLGKFFSMLTKHVYLIGNPLLDRILTNRIKSIIHSVQPDIIHVQDIYILPAVASVESDIPVIVTVRNPVPLPDDFPINSFAKLLLKNREKVIIGALRKCNSIIAVSNYIKKLLLSAHFESGKIDVVYNLPPTIVSNVNAWYNGTFTFLAPGRITIDKGYSTLIKSVEIIEKNRNFKVVVAGDGPYLKRMITEVVKKKLEKYFEFTGQLTQEEMSLLYMNCNAVLQLSEIGEPFSRVPLEAMAYSKPIIVSDSGGNSEAVEDGINGLVVPSSDYHAVSKAMETYILNYQIAMDHGQSGNNILRSKFDMDKMIRRIESIYNYYVAIH